MPQSAKGTQKGMKTPRFACDGDADLNEVAHAGTPEDQCHPTSPGGGDPFQRATHAPASQDMTMVPPEVSTHAGFHTPATAITTSTAQIAAPPHFTVFLILGCGVTTGV
jgi:hypothetical protein